MSISLTLGCKGLGENTYKLSVDTESSSYPISPLLYGTFFEDINYGADGGLNAELLKNPYFNFPSAMTGWSLTGGDSKAVKRMIDGNLEIEVAEYEDKVILRNDGYLGIGIKKNEEYNLKFKSRVAGSDKSLFTIKLIKKDGSVLYTKQYLNSSEWTEKEVIIVLNESVKDSTLVVEFEEKGINQFEYISMTPVDTYKGHGLRKDLAEMIEATNPTFFRFPGGCIIEGSTMDNAYNWKDTIGPLKERKTNNNLWGYVQSYSLGYYEYFIFCEDLGAEPLPVVNVGMACQARGGNCVDLDDLDIYIQDALDLIEYANGGIDTNWGSKRAEAGHPEPFNLKYIAVGNEQWGETFFVHYEKFYDVIRAAYPEIQIVMGGAGPLAEGGMVDYAYEWAKNGKADIIDEHFYMSPEWFLTHTDRYDSYDRSGPKVFLGEYAAHVPNRDNNLYSSLAEAAFMMGMEKNGDIVEMASYAPLLAKEGATQWEPDMIRFNNLEVFGTPNYYVQKVFSESKGDYFVPTTLKSGDKPEPIIPISGMPGFSSWDTTVEYKDLKITNSKGKTSIDGFSDKSLWKNSGSWQEKNGSITGNTGQGALLLLGDKEWDNYIISVKAKKKFGGEGFIISFGSKDFDNYYWWNLGGWGNTQSGIEKSEGGIRSLIGGQEAISIDKDTWYDIRVELEGNRVRCYLDDRLIHEVTDNRNIKPLYSNVTKSSNGDIYIKMVNVTNESKTIDVDLSMDLGAYSNLVEKTLITGDPGDVNSFNEPDKVEAVTTEERFDFDDFSYETPAFSLTVLKISKY